MTRADINAADFTAAVRPVGMMRLAAASLSTRLVRFWKTRQAMHQLSELSDWQLSDIGLTRCDIDAVALNVPHNEATRMLQQIASRRTCTKPSRSDPMQA